MSTRWRLQDILFYRNKCMYCSYMEPWRENFYFILNCDHINAIIIKDVIEVGLFTSQRWWLYEATTSPDWCVTICVQTRVVKGALGKYNIIIIAFFSLQKVGVLYHYKCRYAGMENNPMLSCTFWAVLYWITFEGILVLLEFVIFQSQLQ